MSLSLDDAHVQATAFKSVNRFGAQLVCRRSSGFGGTWHLISGGSSGIEVGQVVSHDARHGALRAYSRDLEELIREGEKKRAEVLARRAKAVHEASTEHVRAQVNELHHVIALTIAPELLAAGRHDQLEHEILDSINRARVEANKHTGTDPVQWATALMLNDG